MIPIKERVAKNHRMAPKKEERTYHRDEKCLDSSAPERRASPPEYSGINKGQRAPDRSETAHRRPLVKCSLTVSKNLDSLLVVILVRADDWEGP